MSEDLRSRTIGGMISALAILMEYEPVKAHAKGFCDAEHDIIYFGSAPAPDSEDGRLLVSLGFHWSDADRWAYHT